MEMSHLSLSLNKALLFHLVSEAFLWKCCINSLHSTSRWFCWGKKLINAVATRNEPKASSFNFRAMNSIFETVRLFCVVFYSLEDLRRALLTGGTRDLKAENLSRNPVFDIFCKLFSLWYPIQYITGVMYTAILGGGRVGTNNSILWLRSLGDLLSL